jgi:hypothetical protein
MNSLGSSYSWEGAVKPDAITVDSYEGELFAQRTTDIPSSMIKRFDYGARTDDNAVYIGFAPKGLSEGTDGWLIYKFTYEDSPVTRVTKIDTAFGNWTNRSTYF